MVDINAGKVPEKVSRPSVLDKLNLFLKQGKAKKGTRTFLLHRLKLAINDSRPSAALDAIDGLTTSGLKKGRVGDVSKAFLTAQAARQDQITAAFIDRGFPQNVNNPVFGQQKAEHAKQLVIPSHFLLAVAFQSSDLVKKMLKVKNC